MKVETKFNVGDEVLFLRNGKICSDVVREIQVVSTTHQPIQIRYSLSHLESKEEYLYKDLGELSTNLMERTLTYLKEEHLHKAPEDLLGDVKEKMIRKLHTQSKAEFSWNRF